MLSEKPDGKPTIGWVYLGTKDDGTKYLDIFNSDEAAEAIGKSEPTIRRWIREGRITNVGRSNAPRVRRADVLSPGRRTSGGPDLAQIVLDRRDSTNPCASKEGVTNCDSTHKAAGHVR